MPSIKIVTEAPDDHEPLSRDRTRLSQLLNTTQVGGGRKKIKEVMDLATDNEIDSVLHISAETITDPEKDVSKFMETLFDVFGGNTQEIAFRMTKSNLSVKNMNRRIERLKSECPDCWMDFIRSRSTALSCSEKDFETMIRSFLCTMAETECERKLLQILGQRYSNNVEHLMEMKAKAHLSAEEVLFRLEEAESISGGVKIQLKRARIFVAGSHEYNKWIGRIKGFAEGFKMILDNCPDHGIASKWIKDILASDARRDKNTHRAMARLKKILTTKGPSALRDALMSCRKALLTYNDSLWQERGRIIGSASVSLSSMTRNISKKHPMADGLQPEEHRGFLVFNETRDLGIRVSGTNGERLIRRLDRPIYTLYVTLFLLKNKAVAVNAAKTLLTSLLQKKKWNTSDEIRLLLIRQFALRMNIIELVQLMSNNKRLKEFFSSGHPKHADYRPDLFRLLSNIG